MYCSFSDWADAADYWLLGQAPWRRLCLSPCRDLGQGEVQALDAYVRIFFLFCNVTFQKITKIQHQVKKKALTNIL